MGKLSRQDGFTLIELMVVVAILSVLTVGATLSFGLRDRQGASDVSLLRAQVAAARRDAILSGEAQILELGAGSLTRRSADKEHQSHPLTGEIRIIPERGVTEGLEAIALHFLPDGRSSVFEARLVSGGGLWTCYSDGWTDLTCEVAG